MGQGRMELVLMQITNSYPYGLTTKCTEQFKFAFQGYNLKKIKIYDDDDEDDFIESNQNL